MVASKNEIQIFVLFEGRRGVGPLGYEHGGDRGSGCGGGRGADVVKVVFVAAVWFCRRNRQKPKKFLGPKINDQRPKTKDRRPRTKDKRAMSEDQRPKTKGQRPGTKDQGPTTKGPKTKDRLA